MKIENLSKNENDNSFNASNDIYNDFDDDDSNIIKIKKFVVNVETNITFQFNFESNLNEKFNSNLNVKKRFAISKSHNELF